MSKSDALYPSLSAEEQHHQPPPAGYAPAPDQKGVATVMVSSPVVSLAYGPTPQAITCPHCHTQITSDVRTEATTKTHLMALLMCLFGCIPCCLIPYCMDSCKNRNHYCSSCGAYLGSYHS